MQTYKTNIKCNSCVAKVKPYLESIKEISSWDVDLASPDRILKVDGEVSDEVIIKALAKAGYHAEKI